MPGRRSSATARRRASSTSIASSTAALRALAPQRPGRGRCLCRLDRARQRSGVRPRGARGGRRAQRALRRARAARSSSPARDGSAPSALPRGTPATLAIALARIAELMDKERGRARPLHDQPRRAVRPLLSRRRQRLWRDLAEPAARRCSTSSASRNRLLILSACYSGVFVPRLQSETHRDRHRRLVRPHLVRLRRRE